MRGLRAQLAGVEAGACKEEVSYRENQDGDRQTNHRGDKSRPALPCIVLLAGNWDWRLD